MSPAPIVLEGFSAAAEQRRARVSADLTGRGASILLWLAVSLSLGGATMLLVDRLCIMEAAARSAAGV